LREVGGPRREADLSAQGKPECVDLTRRGGPGFELCARHQGREVEVYLHFLA